ncbi:MAG: hypothetical protein AB7V77_06030, partial [Candidatus Woesearchaeota archaeon]
DRFNHNLGCTINSFIICRMKLFLLFLILFLIPSSYAFDCSLINNENCEYLNEVNEDLIANLIYTSSYYPNHTLIKEYNNNIQVNEKPLNTPTYQNNNIKNAWLEILTISPSIKYNNSYIVPQTITARAEYNYQIQVPEDYYNPNKRNGATCKINYNLQSQSSNINWYANTYSIGNQKILFSSILNYNSLKAKVNIQSSIKKQTYVWNRYCCGWSDGSCVRHCYNCKYKSTTYINDNLEIVDEVSIIEYEKPEISNFTFITEYLETHKGILETNNLTNTILNFNNASLKNNNLVFTANFTHKPYYFLELEAKPTNQIIPKNLRFTNNTIYVNEPTSCSITTTDLFQTTNEECINKYQELELAPFEKEGFTENLYLLVKLAVFVFVNILIYKGIKKYWGKILVPISILIFTIPSVHAETECGLTNLASCIPEKMYEFILNLINAPLQPLLELVKNLLQAHPSITLFHGIWAIVVYCISMFYGLLLIYAGMQFLFSGHNVVRREMAKEWLKNVIIMMVLIQASFYLYDLAIELGSVMSSSVLSLVDPLFFMLTADNLVNIGLEFIMVFIYAITLIFTLFFLVMRYLVVALGVLFVPIGIFCYFIPPLKSYGKMILNLLGLFVFINFLSTIIILACSMLITIPLFENIKIVIMINCFGIVNLLFILLAKHVVTKSGMADGAEKVVQAGKYIAMLV